MIAFPKSSCLPLGRKPAAKIDLGLALLSVRREPGERFSHREIAAWCDCTEVRVRQIERKALMKLRRLVRRGESALCEELSETAPARTPSVMAPRAVRETVEMPFKQWVAEEAARCGVKPGAIYMRLLRHPEKRPAMRRVNRRVLMVQLAAELPATEAA